MVDLKGLLRLTFIQRLLLCGIFTFFWLCMVWLFLIKSQWHDLAYHYQKYRQSLNEVAANKRLLNHKNELMRMRSIAHDNSASFFAAKLDFLLNKYSLSKISFFEEGNCQELVVRGDYISLISFLNDLTDFSVYAWRSLSISNVKFHDEILKISMVPWLERRRKYDNNIIRVLKAENNPFLAISDEAILRSLDIKDIKWSGTICDSQYCMATITLPNEYTKYISIGDNLSSESWNVEKIFNDKVILKNKNRELILDISNTPLAS